MEEKSYKCGICLDKKESMEWAEIGGIHIAEGNGDLFQYSCLGIPWTEEPGRLQSTGSQRVRHDIVTKQQQ